MEILEFRSKCDAQLNTKIMRIIGNLTTIHEKVLVNDWRVIVEFQRAEDEVPYYLLDVGSDGTAGSEAPAKRSSLRDNFSRASTLDEGGIRVPYDIFVTESKPNSNTVREAKGEIRVIFDSSACCNAPWQNTFFAFIIMRKIQEVLMESWQYDQISFDISGLASGSDATTIFINEFIPLLRCPSGI